MKINIVSVGKPWVPADKPDKDPMWTIIVAGIGEPQKTFDPILAQRGEREAEVFKSREGKEYWRSPKDTTVEPYPAGDSVSGSNATGATQVANAKGEQQPAAKWQPKDDAAIRAMWSIGQAVALQGEGANLDTIEAMATNLFDMVNRVKNPQTTLPMQDLGDHAKFQEEVPIEAYNDYPM